jgi:tRNA-2-methylthio-N6-dimethylallyladenosine synthase
MNRRHTRADYLRTVERLRAARPDIAFTSDFIVGFPGETEGDFEDTMKLVDEVGFVAAFTFKYSPRPGTPAADMDQVPEAVKDERLQRLQRDITARQDAFLKKQEGVTFDVLFEKTGRHPGQIVGRSPYLQPVQVMAAPSMIEKIAPVTITEIGSNSLFGELATVPESAARPQLEAAGA